MRGKVATRRCKECEDPFCDECYDEIHAKGRLAAHTWDWIGAEEKEALPEVDAAADGYATEYDQGYGAEEWVDAYEQHAEEDYASEYVGGDGYASGFATDADAAYATEGGDDWQEFLDEESGRRTIIMLPPEKRAGQTRIRRRKNGPMPNKITPMKAFPQQSISMTQVQKLTHLSTTHLLKAMHLDTLLRASMTRAV